MSKILDDLLGRVRRGELKTTAAAEQIRELAAQALGFATVDHARVGRCGSAEVIYAAGKTPPQVVSIARAIRRHHPVVLVTRAGPAHVQAIRRGMRGQTIEVGSRGSTVLVGKPAMLTGVPAVPIVTAGTSDESVAEEAALTCRAMGHVPLRINDVGVAGLHRLGARLGELREANVIVCIAGMEGALPSVIGGLVDVPVIGVPTSVGYGAALGGVTALLSMLTSCASGVCVVNIDNGFGAAHTACLINGLGVRAEKARGKIGSGR